MAGILATCTVAAAVIGAGAPAGAGDLLYWQEYSGRHRAQVEGFAQDILVTGIAPNEVAVADAAGLVYWTETASPAIRRIGQDGSGLETIVTSGLVSPQGIVVDGAAGKVYWADAGTLEIQRSNLDGSGVETVYTASDSPTGSDCDVLDAILAIDPVGGSLWTALRLFFRVGTSVSSVDLRLEPHRRAPGARPSARSPRSPRGVPEALLGRRADQEIQRANYDGSSVEPIVDLSPWGTGRAFLAIEQSPGTLYWTTEDGNGSSCGFGPNGQFWSATLGGSGIQLLATHAHELVAFAYSEGSGRLYWSHDTFDYCGDSDSDGTFSLDPQDPQSDQKLTGHTFAALAIGEPETLRSVPALGPLGLPGLGGALLAAGAAVHRSRSSRR